MASDDLTEPLTDRFDGPYGTFFALRGDLIAALLEKYGAHQRNELAMLLSLLRPGDTVLDVGAHIGTFSVPMAWRVAPHGRVYAFEPAPQTFEILRRNIAANNCSELIRPSPVAVSDRQATHRLCTLGGNTGATYLAPADGSSPAVALDQWVIAEGVERTIACIKIDAEGMELKVLRGAERLIACDRPLLFVEICEQQLQRWGHSVADIEGFLLARGYDLFRHTGPRHSCNDDFSMQRLHTLPAEGLYDVLAIHPATGRLPSHASP
jgi:FkbM family methyltransferase